MLDGSSLFALGGFHVTGNGAGIVASDSRVTVISPPANPASISGNAAPFDLSLAFGSRSTLQGPTVDGLQCDGTVLSQGTLVCP